MQPSSYAGSTHHCQPVDRLLHYCQSGIHATVPHTRKQPARWPIQARRHLQSSSSSILRTLTENRSSLVQHGKAAVCRNHLKRRKGISQPRGSAGFYEEYSVRNSRNLCRPTSAWAGNEMRGQGEDKRVSPCCGFLGIDRNHIMKRDSPILCGEREETATQE